MCVEGSEIASGNERKLQYLEFMLYSYDQTMVPDNLMSVHVDTRWGEEGVTEDNRLDVFSTQRIRKVTETEDPLAPAGDIITPYNLQTHVPI